MKHFQASPNLPPPLTAQERAGRAVDGIINAYVRSQGRGHDQASLNATADEYQDIALRYIDAISATNDTKARLTYLEMAGLASIRAQIYRAVAATFAG